MWRSPPQPGRRWQGRPAEQVTATDEVGEVTLAPPAPAGPAPPCHGRAVIGRAGGGGIPPVVTASTTPLPAGATAVGTGPCAVGPPPLLLFLLREHTVKWSTRQALRFQKPARSILMPVRRQKSHPALKHGGYAATQILPGESVAEFDKLHRDLTADFTAEGALEADIVEDLAARLWRKQNLATFRTAEVARRRYDEIKDRHANRFAGLQFITEADARERCGYSEEKELQEKAELAEREDAIRAADEIARNELGEDTYELAKMADTVTLACLMKDLAVEERLDAMIDKCIKRLLLAKGLKSISASSSSAPPKRLAARAA